MPMDSPRDKRYAAQAWTRHDGVTRNAGEAGGAGDGLASLVSAAVVHAVVIGTGEGRGSDEAEGTSILCGEVDPTTDEAEEAEEDDNDDVESGPGDTEEEGTVGLSVAFAADAGGCGRRACARRSRERREWGWGAADESEDGTGSGKGAGGDRNGDGGREGGDAIGERGGGGGVEDDDSAKAEKKSWER